MKGKVIEILPIESGISKAQKEWKRQSFVIDNYDQYNPKPGRTLRLIRAANKEDAEILEARLTQGESFAKVARSKLNRYQPATGGLMSEPAVGEKVFGFDQLNKAMLALKEGEHSDLIIIDNAGNKSYWCLYIEKINEGKKKSLRDVQLQIERLLNAQQYSMLIEQYRLKIMKEGSYNPLNEMGWALVEIVMSKYKA